MLKAGMKVKLTKDLQVAWNGLTIGEGSIIKVKLDDVNQLFVEVVSGEVKRKTLLYDSVTSESKYVMVDEELPIETNLDSIALEEVEYRVLSYFCPKCGKTIKKSEALEDKNTFACKDCAKKYSKTCEDCGKTELFPVANGIFFREFKGKTLCTKCFREKSFICPSCNELHLTTEAFIDEHGVKWCSEECKDKYTVKENDYIWDYSTKPDPVFFGKGLTMGVELEVDGDDYEERNNLAYALSEISGLHYCKDDGSLDNGVEIVTMPCSLEYHKKKFPWRDIMDTALDYGFLSDKAGTCGLHVHVDKDYFETDYCNYADAAVALMYLFNKFSSKFIKFSRRFESQLSWGKIKEVDIYDTHSSYDQLTEDRYNAINVLNKHTLEFRLWKGTLNYKTFIATLEMTQNLCDLVRDTLRDHGTEGIVNLTWADICNYGDYDEMVEYLKKRDIYETVEAAIA